MRTLCHLLTAILVFALAVCGQLCNQAVAQSFPSGPIFTMNPCSNYPGYKVITPMAWVQGPIDPINHVPTWSINEAPASAIANIPTTVNSLPAVTSAINPTTPNLLTGRLVAGSQTYPVIVGCDINVSLTTGRGTGVWAYYMKTAPTYPTVNFSGLPLTAMVNYSAETSAQVPVSDWGTVAYLPNGQAVRGTGLTFTLDINKIVMDISQVPVFYNGYTPDSPLTLRANSYSSVAHPKTLQETGSCACEGDPCDPYSRNYFHHEIDLALSGLMPLQVQRNYYSGKNAFKGEFGVGSYLESYNNRVLPAFPSAPITAANNILLYNPGDNENIAFTNQSAGGTIYVNNAALGTAGDSITVLKDSAGNLSGYVYTELNKTKQYFNVSGLQTSQVDRYGNQLTLTRDAGGRLTAIKDETTKRQINIVYNTAGFISSVSDSAGRSVSYAYSTAGELLSVTNPEKKLVTYKWAGGRITNKTDWLGKTRMSNTYDATTGAITAQTLADGGAYTFSAPSDTVRKVSLPDGGARQYVYNTQGYLVEIDDPIGNMAKTTFSPNVFSNLSANRYIQQTDELGNIIRVDLNSSNLPTLITDSLGQKTTLTYNATMPELVSAVTDPLGHKTSYGYDSLGNLTSVTDNQGNVSTMTYNPKGQLLTVTNALGQKSSYAYDSLFQLSSVTNALGQKVLYAYDALGRVTSVTDPAGKVTSFTYDVMDRVISSKNPLGQVVSFNYDANGNLISQTDARGKITTLSYDAKGRLTQAVNPLGKSSLLTYTGSDLVKTSQDPKSQLTTNTYDLANQMTRTAFADGTAYSYGYDKAGQLLNITDGSKTWGYTYDQAGRVTAASAPLATLNYTYNANDSLTQMTSPQYGTVNYGYDNLDRVTSVNKDNQNFTYTYDPLGNRTSLSRPNGSMTVYEYDAGNRLTALTHVQGTTVPERYEYSYDLNGNISKIIRGQGTLTSVKDVSVAKGSYKQVVGYTRNALEETERRFTYDALNRLTNVVALGYVPGASNFNTVAAKTAAQNAIAQARAATTAAAMELALKNAEAQGAVIPENATWTFDANGNIATKVIRKAGGALETRTFTYDDANRLTQMTKSGASTGTITYLYDANGNLISDSSGRQMTWNAQDQLTGLSVNGNANSFAYDPLGRRVSYTKPGTLKTYFYNGQDLLSDGANKFLSGTRLDETLQEENSSGLTSYLQDHLGSTSQLLSSSGASLARYDYKSYGKLEGDIANPVSNNPMTYTGREDDSTGLMYYRARYYDPELEAFISQDPLGDAQRYVDGNPMSFTDPLGLEPNMNFINHGPGAKDGDNLIYNAAQRFVPKSTDWWGVFNTPYTIVSHGNPSFITDQKGNRIYPKDLAKMILKDPNYRKGQKIKLYGCRTGEGTNSFAQQLARELKFNKTEAPNRQQWWSELGPREVMGKKQIAPHKFVPDPSKPGWNRTFSP